LIILEQKDLTIVMIHGNSWQLDLTRTRGIALIAVRDPLQFRLNTIKQVRVHLMWKSGRRQGKWQKRISLDGTPFSSLFYIGS
jgi:hypothetical protein